MALFDFLMGGGDAAAGPSPQAAQMAQMYGADPALVQNLLQQRQASILGQVGASLLAAGQQGPMGQRGRLLAGLGDAANAGPNVTSSLMNAAQMKLYSESLKDKQTERQTREAIKAEIERLDLPPVERAVAMADPVAYWKTKAERDRLENDPLRLAQTSFYKSQEAARLQAVKEKDARTAAVEEWIKTLPPEQQALYRANPERAQDALFDQELQRVRNMKGGAGMPGAPGAPGTPGFEPPKPSLDPTIDFKNGIGTGSALYSAANTALAPLGTQASPEVDKAVKAWNRLNLDTNTALAQAFKDQPSNYALKRFEALTVNPASAFTTKEGAVSSVNEIVRSLDDAIDELSVVTTYGGTPSQVALARRNIYKLSQMKANYEAVRQSLMSDGSPAAAGAPAQGGAASPPPARIISVRPANGQ